VPSMQSLRFLLTLMVIVILTGACAQHSLSSTASSGSHMVTPFIVQTGNQPTDWEEFSNQLGEHPTNIAIGPDRRVWYSTYEGGVWQIDIATGYQGVAYASGLSSGRLTAGPDRNMWSCNETLAKITIGRNVKEYPVSVFCNGITAGPDGNLWMTDINPCSLQRSTTDGVVSQISDPYCPETPQDIIVGPDGNLWFTEGGTYAAVARFSIATSTFSEFKAPMHAFVSGLDSPGDGNLYSCDAGRILQISMDGAMRIFTPSTSCATVSNSGKSRYVYLITQYGRMAEWSIVGHGITLLAPVNLLITQNVRGPDGNIYGLSNTALDVYINHVISVGPTSATLVVGGSQVFKISETKCKCVWTAVSSSPIDVSVSPVRGNSFIATALRDSGTPTQITVSDQRRNVFQVFVNVQ